MLIDGNNVAALIVLEQKVQYVELWEKHIPPPSKAILIMPINMYSD
jgi:hypothetical protein